MGKHILVYLLFINEFIYGQGCTNNVCNCGQQNDTSTCLSWGNHYVKTFDDHGLSFESNCELTLASFTVDQSEFRVDTMKKLGCRCKTDTTSAYTNILFKGTKYQLCLNERRIPVFKENGSVHSIPVELEGIRVHQPANRIVVEFLGTGVVIKWDEKNMVEITIENKRSYNPVGLCGNKDRCSSNDQMSPDGTVTDDLNTFLENWKVDKENRPGSLKVPEPCMGNRANLAKAEHVCKSILEGSRFQEANRVVNPQIYIDACVSNYCSCNSTNAMDCLCETFDAYAKASINAGLKKVSWRDKDVCHKECKGDQVFYPCAPKGGARTCTDSGDLTDDDQKCEEGCYCPVSTFLFNDGKCYLKKKCPCTLGGKIYQPGDTVKQSCHTCTCTNGRIKCPKKPCLDVSGVVTGDPHYTTFDGRKYDFMGKCSYYLVKANDFSIEADHFVYKNKKFIKENSSAPSFIRQITVRVDNQVVVMNPKLVTLVNNQTVRRYPHKDGTLIVTKPCNSKVLVQLPNYVQVEWDGVSTGIVRLPNTLEGKVMGLLGTYTGDKTDDFVTPDGDIVKNAITFGNSWKTEYSCQNESPKPFQHPCDANPSAKRLAKKLCIAIKSNMFKKCKIKDVETSFDNCLYDTCYTKEERTKYACDAIAAFAEGCAKKGISVNWRAKFPQCKVPCAPGQVYQACNDGCSRSCEDISYRPDCAKVCVEGCNCAPGTTMDEEGRCIPVSQCKCRLNGACFPPGFQYLKNEFELLTCTNAKWVASDPPPLHLNFSISLQVLNQRCTNPFSMYTACKCPTPKTCENMHNYEIKSIAQCSDGCECIEGYVVNTKNNQCVEPQNCPCYLNGISHNDGAVFKREDCTQCTCIGGSWSCTSNGCGRECNENERRVDGCRTCVCQNGKWNCPGENCQSQTCQSEGQRKMDGNLNCICNNGVWRCTDNAQCSILGINIQFLNLCFNISLNGGVASEIHI